MNKKYWWALCILVVVLLIASYWQYSQLPKEPTGEAIKIGLAVGLTGYAANWGEGEVKAVEIALSEYEKELGVPVILVVEDTKSTGVGTVNAMRKLIEVDKVRAIIGPTWGDSFQGGYPIAQEANIPVISSSAALETIENKEEFPHLFSTWWPQAEEAGALVSYAKDHGVKKAYLVHDLDAFNTKFADIYSEIAGQNGIAVERLALPIGTTDFRTYIAKIKAAGPDAIFVEFQDTGSIGPFMKQLKEQDIAIQIYSTTSAENKDNVEKFLGQFDGLLYSFPAYVDNKKYLSVKKEFVERYGNEASEGPAFVNAYNAASMLFETIADGARTGEEIGNALTKVKVKGIGMQELSFNEAGQLGDIAFIIKTVQGNQFVEVK